jgi:hypothetical protein
MPASSGLLIIQLHLPEAHTLKDKRQVLQSLLGRLRARLNVAVAETGHQDLHQRAEISLACVAGTVHGCDHILDDALALVESEPRAVVLSAAREVS